MSKPIFDREHFAHMTGGDAELQAEIVALFREQAPHVEVHLYPDISGWREAVHMLKGSARGLGLWVLAEACEAAEAATEAMVDIALANVRTALAQALETLPS